MHAYSPQLLLPRRHPSTEWDGTDTFERYHHNLKSQPEHWYYRTHSVQYTWNSNGYRCAEWADITWSQSRVVMGCSHAMGTGLDDRDTVSSHFEHGVNLAQPGVSVYHILYNTLRLIDAGAVPKSVDIIVPDLSRAVYWAKDDWVDLTVHDFALRSQDLTDSVRDYYRGYLDIEPMATQSAYMTMRGTQALWSAQGVDCNLYSTWLNVSSEFQLGTVLPRPHDWARDIDITGTAHPGRSTAKMWAEIIGQQHQ